MQEGFFGFHGDLLQRLQTIHSETGADHVDTFHPSLRHGNQGRFRVGLQPFGFPKTGLKSELPFVFGQTQRLGQQTRGFDAFAVVRVAQMQGALGHAVKTHDQFVRLAVLLPIVCDTLG